MQNVFYFLLIIFIYCHSYHIKNVVVLMQENRSFDHLLGHLKKINSNIDGLNGNESNPLYPHDPNSLRYYTSFDALPYIGVNPGHDFDQTLKEIWGQTREIDPAPMNGFVWENHKERAVMRAYNETTVPVISKLALEYAIFDRWYCSIPGPTQPNRLMVHSATSHGNVHDPSVKSWLGGHYAPQKTFYDDLYESGKSWKLYFSDFPIALELSKLRNYPTHIRPILEFYLDADLTKDVGFIFTMPANDVSIIVNTYHWMQDVGWVWDTSSVWELLFPLMKINQ